MTSKTRLIQGLVDRVDLLCPGFAHLHSIKFIRDGLANARFRGIPLEEAFQNLVSLLNPASEELERVELLVSASLALQLFEEAFEEALSSTQAISENVSYLEKLYSSPLEMGWEFIQRAPTHIHSMAVGLWDQRFSLSFDFDPKNSFISLRSFHRHHPFQKLRLSHKERHREAKLIQSAHSTLLGYLFLLGTGLFKTADEKIGTSIYHFVAKIDDLFQPFLSELTPESIPAQLKQAYTNPQSSGSTHSPIQIIRKINEGIETIKRFQMSIRKALPHYGPPPFFLRIIPSLILVGAGSYLAYSAIVGHLVDIKEWTSNNEIVLKNFFSDWVIKPIRDIYHTIRYKQSKLSILRPDELESELKSLESMVGDLAKDRTVDPSQVSQVIESSNRGDITLVMRQYQEEMKHPLQNLLFGNMVRLMLIQVQSMKVDVAYALSSLDQLLRSNELNFAFLSVFPSLFAIGFLSNRLLGWLPNRNKRSKRAVYSAIRSHLRSIHLNLNKFNPEVIPDESTLGAERQGRLLSEISFLSRQVQQLTEREKILFSEDIADLESPNLTIAQRLETIHRIYFTFPLMTSSDGA